jgi:hypothetical protein
LLFDHLAERLFKGQFVATRGIQSDGDLAQRKGSQFGRLASDVRSRLDHLLNTSRWSGRFIRSELAQVEPIAHKEKRNLNPFSASLTSNSTATDVDWLASVQQHVFATTSTIEPSQPSQAKLISADDSSPSSSSKPPQATHWLHFRLFFTDVSTAAPARPTQPGPSASDLYLLLSEELIRSTSGLFSRYGVTQSSLTIAERVPTSSPFAQLHALWQWIRTPGRHWPIPALFSRTIQHRSSASKVIGSSKMAAVHSSASTEYEFLQPTVVSTPHFSDGSSVDMMAVPSSSSSSSASSSSTGSIDSTFCAPIHLTFCDHLPYSRSSYPNLLGHRNQSHLDSDLLSYRQMIDAECDSSARQLLCALLQPPCDDSQSSETVGLSSSSTSSPLTIYSSNTRILNQQNRACSQFTGRVLTSCSDWAPEAVRSLLSKANRSPRITFGRHSDLICSQGDSECVAKLRAQGQRRLLCDHVTDCQDGSDERFCEPIACGALAPSSTDHDSSDRSAIDSSWSRNRSNASDWFDCGTRCVPINQRCDQSMQCDNAQDELDCVQFVQGN